VRGRGNGLTAPSYAPLAVIEPADVDGLLAALAGEGVAAYAALAAAGAAGAVDTRVPEADAPGDPGRVFVDSEQQAAARRVLARALPLVAARLVEQEQAAAFAAIVAAWDAPTERSWPDAEDLGAAPAAPAAQPATRRPSQPSQPSQPPAGAAGPQTPPPAAPVPTAPPASAVPPVASGRVEPHLEDDHYVPPPPPPLPRLRGATLLIVAALTVGVGLLLAPTLVGLQHRTSWDALGVACIVGAVALLVSRMRTTRVDDGPDDGAVV